MGSSYGYEYRHRLWMDEGIIPSYEIDPSQSKTLLFEIRTNFILRKDPNQAEEEDELLDSEQFDASVKATQTAADLHSQMATRLKDYWMPADEMITLIARAYRFAAQIAADPNRASLRVVPVVVAIEVRTVRQASETIGSVEDRAFCARSLVPLCLVPGIRSRAKTGLDKVANPDAMEFLRRVERIRVVDVDKVLGIMRICPICLQRPKLGCEISVLKCKHAFHAHCVYRWYADLHSCPKCESTSL